MTNHYSVLEYIEKVGGRLSKSREKEKIRQQASKNLREDEINILAENKPNEKAYERFKRKAYTTVGGVAIGQVKGGEC